MKLKISTYWKFQLIGWTIFILMIYFYQFLIYTYPPPAFFAADISAFIIGLGFTHLFKMLIQALRVFRKRFRFQVFYLAGLTILISMLATYFWLIIMINIGVLEIRAQYGRTIDFLNAYVGHLFLVLGIFFGWLVIYFLFHYVKAEEGRLKIQLQMVELEAKALRAQMNPHFIFNSMNSIKSLINKNENDKAANYLTTFSKLIRTLFQNSDKREVSLYEELETCKFYTQLERMRFDDKVEFIFDVDEKIDLKDFKVPALILQPFIENAIWHGLIPKETGGKVTISVAKNNGAIQCIIDDNGIGREQSKQFKPQYEATYQSKGIGLTQSRLELDKILNDREDSIQIIDKKNNDDSSAGTKVIILFR